MKKTILLLAIICSVVVGISMAVTLKILNGGRTGSTGQGSASAMDHDMPPGMSHEEHLKQMAAAAAKQQGSDNQPAAGSMDHANMPTGMDHNMPAGMSHEEHLKMMAEAAAKQQNGAKSAPAPSDRASTQPGMEHHMPPGMSHPDHMKMMAAAAAKQPSSGGQTSTAPMDHSNMPPGMEHNMPAGMSHEEHMKMMAAAKPQATGSQAAPAPMDHNNMPPGMDHNMPAGMSHEEHMKMMAATAAKQQSSANDTPADCMNPSAGTDHADHMSMMTDAQGHTHHPGQDDSPDPRPEYRSIKSLTADEIKAYEEGTGHGMAKAAEQNHYPGPRHVLDLAKELQLTEAQASEIQGIKDQMSAAAIATGKQLIENERKLNALFADKRIDQNTLALVVAESASIQRKLRLIHLSAHLQTVKILSNAQIDKYDELRGYKNAKNASNGAHGDHSMP